MAADLNTVMNVFVGSGGGEGYGMANLLITIVVGATMLFLMWAYLSWNKQKGNPYFMYELTKQQQAYVKVEYFKKFGKTFLEDGEENCPYGDKGVYFRRINKLLHIPSMLFINGKNKKIKFIITDTGIGYPVLLTEQINPALPFSYEELKAGNYDDEKVRSFINDYTSWMKVARASDESYDLLLSQHIDTLYQEVQKKADDDKSWQERMMEAAPQFMLLGIIALSFLLNMYFVNDTLVKTNGQNIAVVSEVQGFYTAHLEQQVYCSLMISKYGTENELEKWKTYMDKDKPPVTT
jgi:hypothetical protein